VAGSKTRDVPDIVGMANFAFATHEALPALRGRLTRFPAHAGSEPSPLPKASGRLRGFLYADPFDEAICRGLVGEFAPIVDFQLSSSVQSYRQ
jgi:hypothetical protein